MNKKQIMERGTQAEAVLKNPAFIDCMAGVKTSAQSTMNSAPSPDAMWQARAVVAAADSLEQILVACLRQGQGATEEMTRLSLQDTEQQRIDAEYQSYLSRAERERAKFATLQAEEATDG